MFSKLSAKLESAEADLGKAARALEEVNEANLLLENLFAAELKKNVSLEAQIEGYKIGMILIHLTIITKIWHLPDQLACRIPDLPYLAYPPQ